MHNKLYIYILRNKSKETCKSGEAYKFIHIYILLDKRRCVGGSGIYSGRSGQSTLGGVVEWDSLSGEIMVDTYTDGDLQNTGLLPGIG
jgi:hypothetical protein